MRAGIGEENEGDAFHRVCRSGSLADAIVLIKSNPLLVQKHDQIVKFVLAEYPEAARHADSLGRLPLHLAAANEGPTHDARGMALCPDDQEELQEISNNGFEMVSLLLEVFPAATRARDMDGQLPLDYGLRNTSSALYEIVSGLLTVNPHCLRVEGGTAKVLSDWERVVQDEMLPSLVQCLLHSCPDSCNKTVNLTPAWPQQQLRCLNKLQRQALQVAGEGGSGSGEAADVLGAFMRRLQDCVTQTQAEEGARGELVTDMLADDERQAMFRVLAFEFFKSTGVSEHSHTAGAGAAARARMEREDASAAAAEAAEPAGEGGEAVVGTPMRSGRFPAGEVGAGDGEELGVAGVSKMRIMSRVSSLFSRHGGGVVEESGNPEEREKRPAGAGGFSPGRTTFDGSVGESEPSSTPARNVMSMGSSFVMAAAAAAKFTVKSSRKRGDAALDPGGASVQSLSPSTSNTPNTESKKTPNGWGKRDTPSRPKTTLFQPGEDGCNVFESPLHRMMENPFHHALLHQSQENEGGGHTQMHALHAWHYAFGSREGRMRMKERLREEHALQLCVHTPLLLPRVLIRPPGSPRVEGGGEAVGLMTPHWDIAAAKSPKGAGGKKDKADKLMGTGMTEMQRNVLSVVCAAIQQDLRQPHDELENYQRCPFHKACENPSEDAPAVLATMLARVPSGVTSLDADERLPLHVAAANSSPHAARLVQSLLGTYKRGCMARDKSGRLPIHYAASNHGPCSNAISTMLMQAYPSCAHWPTVPLDAVHVNAASEGTEPERQGSAGSSCGEVAQLEPGSFAVVSVPPEGGCLALPAAEEGVKLCIMIQPADQRNQELLLISQEGDSVQDLLDGSIASTFRMREPEEVLVQLEVQVNGRWQLSRDALDTFPSELALQNTGPASGELLASILCSTPSLALLRDDRGGRLLHRLVLCFQQRQDLFRQQGSFQSEGEGIGCTALSQLMACLSCLPALARGTDVRGMTALHLMASVSLSHFSNAATVLMRHRPESAWQGDANGNTPLHLAVAANNYSVARVLASRADTQRARFLANHSGHHPADLANTRQMRRILVGRQHGTSYSILLMLVSSLVHLALVLMVAADAGARGDTVHCFLTLLGPMLCIIETCWEDVSSLQQSGDEKMVNIIITSLGLRVPWEVFRFLQPAHYLARFAFLENARGWQRNRLFTVKQMESLLSLFPQVVVQASFLLQSTTGRGAVLQTFLFVLCLGMYAHTSTSQDTCEFEANTLKHALAKLAVGMLRTSELVQRVCALALVLFSPFWRLGVALFIAEWVMIIVNWTQLQRVRLMEISMQMLLSSGMNMVGVWEANPFGDGLCERLLGAETNTRRFLGEKSMRGAVSAAVPRFLANVTMTVLFAASATDKHREGGADMLMEWLVGVSSVMYALAFAAHYILRQAMNAEIDTVGAGVMAELNSSAAGERVVGHVEISVLRARDLMDRVTGIPDPYVEARLGWDHERSAALHNTLNPKWVEELVLYVQERHVTSLPPFLLPDGVEGQDGGGKRKEAEGESREGTPAGQMNEKEESGARKGRLNEKAFSAEQLFFRSNSDNKDAADDTQSVQFEVRDADFLSSFDNTLGTCCVPLDFIARLRPQDEVWLQLQNPRIPSALQQGQILVRMQLVLWESDVIFEGVDPGRRDSAVAEPHNSEQSGGPQKLETLDVALLFEREPAGGVPQILGPEGREERAEPPQGEKETSSRSQQKVEEEASDTGEAFGGIEGQSVVQETAASRQHSTKALYDADEKRARIRSAATALGSVSTSVLAPSKLQDIEPGSVLLHDSATQIQVKAPRQTQAPKVHISNARVREQRLGPRGEESVDGGALDIGSDGDDDLDSVWEHSQGESQDWLREAEAELSNAIQVNAAVAAAVLPPRARLNSRVLLPDPEDVGDALPMNRDASDLAGSGNVTMKIGDQDAEAIAKRVPNTEQASRISSRTSHSGATMLAPSSPHGPAPGGFVEGGGTGPRLSEVQSPRTIEEKSEEEGNLSDSRTSGSELDYTAAIEDELLSASMQLQSLRRRMNGGL